MNLANVTNQERSWVDMGFEQRRFIKLSNLQLNHGRAYSLDLRCTNIGDYTSEIVSTNIIVDNLEPRYTGKTTPLTQTLSCSLI